MRTANVVGAGLAGLSAALVLAEAGWCVNLISSQPSERAQSVMAEGGINAVLDLMGEHDTLREHYEETMVGGVFLADPNAVWGLVVEAPRIVRDFLALGVPFNHEHGRMVQRNFGGQRKKRTAYVRGSTGKPLVSALVDAVRLFEERGFVRRFAHHELRDLIICEGRLAGIVVEDVFAGRAETLTGPTILCTGGMGGLFRGLATGSVANTGDAVAIALLRGVELGNLEFLQYHPTTVPIAGKRLLVSEAARGEGGRLFTVREGKRFYFMEELHPDLGNLAPRDVVSREEYRILRDSRCGGAVFLDLTQLPRVVWRRRLPDLRSELIHYLHTDPRKEPIRVSPGIHYCMGGILVDEFHRTNVAGLYAAGECCCQYHGANRVGGNSLLGAVHGGRVAAGTLQADGFCAPPLPDARGQSLPPGPTIAQELRMREVLAQAMGIMRSGHELKESLEAISDLGASARLLLARACVLSALAREESRGAHQRQDFPKARESLRKTTVACLEEGEVAISFRPIPPKREEVGAS